MAEKALRHAREAGRGDALERELALDIGQYRTAVLTAEVQSRRKGVAQMLPALRGLEELRRRHPNEPRIAAAIARSHLALARIYRDTSDAAAAEREAKVGLEMARAAHLEEAEPALTAELLVEHALWLPPERTAEALGLMKQAEVMQRDRLAKGLTRNSQLGLAGVLHARASVLLARGRPREALPLYEEALQLLGKTPAQGTGADRPDARGADEAAFFRARVLQFHARARGQSGDPAAARVDLVSASQQLDQVVARNPDVTRYRLRLAMIFDDLGAALRGARILLVAEATSRKSVAAWSELVRRDGADVDYQKGLLDALLALSDLFMDTGNHSGEAVEILERARPLARKLAVRAARDPDQQYGLARLLSDAGLLRERRLEHALAMNEYAAAVTAMDRVLDLAPGDGYFEDARDAALTRAAAAAARLDRFQEAIGYLERAVSLRGQVASAAPGDALRAGELLDRRLALARAYRDGGALPDAEREADRVLDETAARLKRRDYDFAMRRRSVEAAEIRAQALEKQGKATDASNAWLAALVALGAEHGVDLLGGASDDSRWTQASYQAARARVPAEWRRFSMLCDGTSLRPIDLYVSGAVPAAGTAREVRMKPLLDQIRLAREDDECQVKAELVPALERLNALAADLRLGFGELVDLALNGVWVETGPLIKQVASVEQSCAGQGPQDRRRQATTFERILREERVANADPLGLAAREILRASMWLCAGEPGTAQTILNQVRDRVEELSRLAPERTEAQLVVGTLYRVLGRAELDGDSGDWRRAYGLLQLHEQMACALLTTDDASVADQGLVQAAPLVSKLRRAHGLAAVPLCAAVSPAATE